MTVRNLDKLLAPRSVALIGASTEPATVGAILAANLLAGGFGGPVWLVNPHHRSINGAPCYPAIADLPDVPDLGVIATPPSTVPALVAELAAKGGRAAVIITAGVSGPLRAEMLNVSRPTCLRIQGPNCLGLMLPGIGLNASFSHRMPLKGDLAFLSQSGALITAVIDWAGARGIGFSHVVSLGDMADVDFGDLLDYLAGDTHSRVDPALHGATDAGAEVPLRRPPRRARETGDRVEGRAQRVRREGRHVAHRCARGFRCRL
jgi:acetyltransferase